MVIGYRYRVQGFALCALRHALCALRPASRASLRFSFNIIKSIDLEKIELIIANYRKSVRIYCCLDCVCLYKEFRTGESNSNDQE